MRRRLAATAVVVVVIGLAAAAYWWRHETITIARIAEREDQLRAWIAARPWTAFAVGFSLYTLLSLIPGTPGKAVVWGWFYGFWLGLVIVNGALTIAAVGGFLFSRYLFLDYVEHRFENLARRLEDAWRRDGAFYLLTLRLMGSPYTLTNYAAGATGMQTRTFWWTTQLGLLPRAAVWVFVGAGLPSLRVVAENGVMSLVDPSLLLGVTLMAFLPIFIRYGLRYPLRRSKPRGG